MYAMHNLPSLMRLSLPVHHKARFCLVPLGAFGAVPFSETRKVLGGLGVLVLCEVFRRQQVGLDLVQVPDMVSSLRPRALVSDPHVVGFFFLCCRYNIVRRRSEIYCNYQVGCVPMLP